MRSAGLLLLSMLVSIALAGTSEATFFVGIEGTVAAVSGDGSVVVGGRNGEAFRWTRAGGAVGLGDLPGGAFSSFAMDVSADGTVIVGSSAATSSTEPFRWTAGEGMTSLGVSDARASAVSADGTVIFGGRRVSSFNGTSRVFRWTAEGGAVQLPGQSVDVREGYGIAASSSDGSIAAGNFSTSVGVSRQEALRWTEADGFVVLPTQPSGLTGTFARDMTADGSILVGVGTLGGDQGFRWTAEEGMTILTGIYPESDAYAVSADGSVIVGRGIFEDGSGEASIWDAQNGMRSLTTVLESDFGLDLSGWELYYGSEISDDGRTIIGMGLSPSGVVQGWIAVIPEPGTAALMAVGLGALAIRRRGHA